jgi:N6-L-threonylcarbamoyladenine synthase
MIIAEQKAGTASPGQPTPGDSPTLVLGIETSCDETGVALYRLPGSGRPSRPGEGLLGQALYSQVQMHAEYGGVVPELASRDHIRRVLPLIRQVLASSGCRLDEVDGIAFTEGPGLAGALLVGASVASALAYALGVPAVGIHHLEGHLLSPLLAAEPPAFPFVALLVSGGHTQLMRVDGVGRYRLLGETVDDAAGEAFDKTAQILGLGYPGGPAVSRLAERGRPGQMKLPRPMLASADLDFSFSGLKTAVLLAARRHDLGDEQVRADLARAFQDAMVDVLAAKALSALERTGLERLVVAGGVGANRQLRERLRSAAPALGYRVYYPEPELCTDNGAMIALAGALRLAHGATGPASFGVRPRWALEDVPAA